MITLPPREQSVVNCILDGQSNKAIAYRLGLSEGNVKTHINRIFIKLGVGSRLELAVKMLRPPIEPVKGLAAATTPVDAATKAQTIL